MSSPENYDERVRAEALRLGFDVVGVARADEGLDVEHARYRAFVEAGMHGTMRYLEEHAEVRKRLDTPAILDGAKSVICVGRRYARTSESDDPAFSKTVARYARGRDYHRFLKGRLRRLAAFVRRLGPNIHARALCDIEPVLERAWAARSGLGFVGKHGLVITPGQGSYQLLGEVVTTLELIPGTPLAERCGSCTLCLDACPTQAFTAPFVLDARRCISYLTIEHQGAPPLELATAIGEHFFGCDACQEVCPFNRTAAIGPSEREKGAPFEPHERFADLRLADFVAADEARWAELTTGSPLRRAGRDELARNAAIVAKNRLARLPDDEDAKRALERARNHESHVVRAAAGVEPSDPPLRDP